MAIKIASCEDNPLIRNSLISFFDKIKQEENISFAVDFFESGEHLLSRKQANYDIYILDINLGDQNLDGMTLAQTIRKYDEKTLIIFLTSLTKFIKDGYKVKAYRYLTKPISYNEFKKEICSAINDIANNDNNYINLIGHSKFNRIMLDDIYFIETNGRKTLIHTRSGNVDCTYSISALTDMLKDKNFFRCHNSYLINIPFVERFDSKTVRVHGVDLLVSRNRVKDLKNAVSKSVSIYF